MSLVTIKKALEKRLQLITPSISTSYESVSFTPVTGEPYQKVQIIPRQPDNPTLGGGCYREVGEFQVVLAYPSNVGTLDVLTRAELVQQHFARGTSITEGSLTVIIPRTPQIAGASVIGDRVIVPVIIRYLVEITN